MALCLTWVQPAERASWSHDICSAADKIPPISHDDAVLSQELIHTVQNTQRVQMPLGLLICFRSEDKTSFKGINIKYMDR